MGPWNNLHRNPQATIHPRSPASAAEAGPRHKAQPLGSSGIAKGGSGRAAGKPRAQKGAWDNLQFSGTVADSAQQQPGQPGSGQPDSQPRPGAWENLKFSSSDDNATQPNQHHTLIPQTPSQKGAWDKMSSISDQETAVQTGHTYSTRPAHDGRADPVQPAATPVGQLTHSCGTQPTPATGLHDFGLVQKAAAHCGGLGQCAYRAPTGSRLCKQAGASKKACAKGNISPLPLASDMGCGAGHSGSKHASWESPAADGSMQSSGWGGQERQPRQAEGDWNVAAQASDWNAAAAPGRDPAAAGSEPGGRRKERKPSERRERKPRPAGQRTDGGDQQLPGDARCSPYPCEGCPWRLCHTSVIDPQLHLLACWLSACEVVRVLRPELGPPATPSFQGGARLLCKACHACYNSCSSSRHQHWCRLAAASFSFCIPVKLLCHASFEHPTPWSPPIPLTIVLV